MTKLPPTLSTEDLELIEQEINEYVGLRLRQGRSRLGIKQKDLADYLGCSFQQLQKYEKGTNRLGPAKMFRFAHLLGVKTDYFFDGLHDGKPQQLLDRRRRRLVQFVLAAQPGVQDALLALLKAIDKDPKDSC